MFIDRILWNKLCSIYCLYHLHVPMSITNNYGQPTFLGCNTMSSVKVLISLTPSISISCSAWSVQSDPASWENFQFLPSKTISPTLCLSNFWESGFGPLPAMLTTYSWLCAPGSFLAKLGKHMRGHRSNLEQLHDKYLTCFTISLAQQQILWLH